MQFFTLGSMATKISSMKSSSIASDQTKEAQQTQSFFQGCTTIFQIWIITSSTKGQVVPALFAISPTIAFSLLLLK